MNNIDKSINKILGNKKKVKGASIKKQNQWKNMSMSQRNNARKKYKDSDGDRVPNMFDCQPNNIMRQDFMLNSDQYDFNKKQFKHAKTGRKVIMMPVEKLYHMRARYNLHNKSYVPTDNYSDMKDKRELIAIEKGMTNVEKYKMTDKDVAKEMINDREDMLKRRKLVPYPSKIRNDESGFVKGVNIKYRHTPNKYKQEVEYIMQPNNYADNAGERRDELRRQGMQDINIGTTLRNEYYNDMVSAVKSKEAKVPMITLHGIDVKENVIGEGRHRILAAREAGLKEVPVFVEPNNRLPEGSLDKYRELSNDELEQFNNKPVNNLMSDNDGDGVVNVMDCDPNDETKQGPTHKYMQSRRPMYEKKNSSWWDINTKPKQQKYSPDLEDNDDNNKMIMFAIKKRMREKAEKEAYENEVINNINMQVRELGTSLKKKKNPADNLMSDTDGDGVTNVMDCDPNDKTKQGPTHNYYNYTQIAKQGVREEQEVDKEGSCLGHCAEISHNIYHRLKSGDVKSEPIQVDLYDNESIRHTAVHIPNDNVIVDTQVWQFDNDKKDLSKRKVVYTPEEYKALGFTIKDNRMV